MRDIFSGPWVQAVSAGIISGVATGFISEWLNQPTVQRLIYACAAALAAFAIALIMEKRSKKMKNTDPAEGQHDSLPAFVKATDCQGLILQNNSVPKGVPLLHAENTTGIELEGNEQRE